jgi:DNA polymerase-3 subunit delta
MRLYPDKLESHLAQQLKPVYLLHGDEPLQIMEASDKLRAQARQSGFTERTVFQPVDDNDWSMLREAADSLSLFADKRIIDLRLPTGKPGRTGSDVLKQYCVAPHDDVLLLITSGKLERASANSAWFKAIDKVGVTIGVSVPAANQLGQWLKRRLLTHGLQADSDALALIVDRLEGNLLAARQEVERLALLHPAGQLSREDVINAVADSARYSISDLSQAALRGQTARALKILEGLQNEAVADVLVLFSLSQEIRAGARAAEAVEAGVTLDAALKSAGVWQSRKEPLKQAIDRHSADVWLSMLSSCSTIDRQIKGQTAGALHVSVWDALASLIVLLSGRGKMPVTVNQKIPL